MTAKRDLLYFHDAGHREEAAPRVLGAAPGRQGSASRLAPGSRTGGLGYASGREGEVPECQHRRRHRVVFNVKSNAFRLVVRINYAYRVVCVRFLGTHAEYDAVNVEEV